MKRLFLIVVWASLFTLSVVTTSAQVDAPKPKPTLFIVGDSTVHNTSNGFQGWGDVVGEFFDQTRINVVNRARGGRSSRTFQAEGLWDQVLAELKPGDYVLIQFGHNDGGAVNDASRARGSLRGIGEETEEIDNLVTKKHEVVHTYGWYLRKYVSDTKAKGATPIIFSQVARNKWEAGRVERVIATFGGWAAAVAQSTGSCFVDLNELTAKQFETIGQERVTKELFLTDHTHTNTAGAKSNAEAAVAGLRSLKACDLAKYLKNLSVGASLRGRPLFNDPGFEATRGAPTEGRPY